jgi:pimeloyl-ACP methyl ester carboxylesterase
MSGLVTPATTANEVVGFFGSGEELLFGVVTLPVGEPRGTGVVLLSAASWIPAAGKNRLWVHMARRLAADGYHVLRFDYHGVGESTGEVDEYGLDPHFDADVAAGVEWLRSYGADRIVLAGWCFGARLALRNASRIPGIDGVIALSLLLVESEGAVTDPKSNPPLARRALRRETLRRLANRRYRAIYWRVIKGRLRALGAGARNRVTGGKADRWSSRAFLDEMSAAGRLGIPVAAVFGSEEPFYRYFQEARAGALGGLLEAAGGKARVEVVGRDVKRLVHVDDQIALVDAMPRLVAWCEAAAR